MQGRGFRTAVRDRDLNQNIFDIAFRVLDENIEVPVFVKYSGVEQFVLRFALAPAAIFSDELRVGEGGLRVLVQVLHVRVGGSAVEIEVIFLHIFAMIAFGAAEAEEPLLKYWVALIPERDGKTDELPAV